MMNRMPWFLVFCLLFQTSSGPVQRGDVSIGQVVTEAQALSFLRSNGTITPGSVLTAVTKVELKSAQLAEKSLRDATSKHLDLFGGGILLDLMRGGGYVFLESDTKSDEATMLHLVTRDPSGEAVVESNKVDGDLNRTDAMAIIKKSEAFYVAFLKTPGSKMDQLLRTFAGKNIATPSTPDEGGYFGIPKEVRRLAPGPDELVEFRSLYTAVQLWSVRHAPWIPVYAANPSAAVGLAKDNQMKLEGEFLIGKGKDPSFIYDLFDLDSIRTREEFKVRLQWLKELNSFLDDRSPSQPDSPSYKASAQISTLALQAGVQKEHSENVYFVMNTSGLIMAWIRTKSGDFQLKGLSVGE
jgi:hypothetical protein